MPDTTPRDRPAPPRVQPHLLALPGYDPVTPVDQLAAQAGIDPADVLKLDANENPFGAHPAVRRALADFDAWSLYPDPLQLDLRAAIAEYVGVPPDRIVAGAGSDELIELSVRALVGPGQRILSCPPTFGMYRFLADVAAIPLDEVERHADFTLDLDSVLAAITPDTALIILASPNNPSGTPLPDEDLAALLDTGATVAIDEAYGEYAGVSALDRFADHPRLIVFRTFSKWAGLAGLRAGYGVFPTDLAPALLRVKQPYNVNLAADVAMRAALGAKDELLAQAQLVVQERERLARNIADLGWLTPYPSAANFLLCEVASGPPNRESAHPEALPSEVEGRVPPQSNDSAHPEPVEGREPGGAGQVLQAALAARGVFVRVFSTPRLQNCVRISCPRPDQHQALMSRLRDVGAELGYG
ncbi:MAG: histidinol-phosphate aminotransferase [Chloroflexi bacterium]|nr:MAG: histidinol-phosphate aminotransferase [Chloroflexota bacterium]